MRNRRLRTPFYIKNEFDGEVVQVKENFEIKMVDESTAKKILGIQGWFLRGEKR